MECFGQKDIGISDDRKSLNLNEEYKPAIWPDNAIALMDKRSPEADDIFTMCGNIMQLKQSANSG